MVPNPSFMYKSVPSGEPVAGKDLTIESPDFDLDAPPPSGGFTTHNIYAAFDPSQRGRMRDPSVKSYSPAMPVGEAVKSVSVIGTVLKSDTSAVKPGAVVLLTSSGTETYSAVPGSALEGNRGVKVLDPPQGVPLTAYLGVLGMTGMTAYGSLHEIGQPKKGQTILVSAAAGAVGQVVGQIAVREGLKVIGSVGDDRKLDFITKELGFTSGFNYKKESAVDAIKRLAPEGLDIYYDNVGGPLLDAALSEMVEHGRIVACGAISTYNNTPQPITNYSQVVRRRLRYEGFIVFDPNIMRWSEERDRNITKWIQEGSFKSVDHLTEGMERAVDGFLGMMRGENLGKSILKIRDEE